MARVCVILVIACDLLSHLRGISVRLETRNETKYAALAGNNYSYTKNKTFDLNLDSFSNHDDKLWFTIFERPGRFLYGESCSRIIR